MGGTISGIVGVAGRMRPLPRGMHSPLRMLRRVRRWIPCWTEWGCATIEGLLKERRGCQGVDGNFLLFAPWLVGSAVESSVGFGLLRYRVFVPGTLT